MSRYGGRRTGALVAKALSGSLALRGMATLGRTRQPARAGNADPALQAIDLSIDAVVLRVVVVGRSRSSAELPRLGPSRSLKRRLGGASESLGSSGGEYGSRRAGKRSERASCLLRRRKFAEPRIASRSFRRWRRAQNELRIGSKTVELRVGD